MASGERIFTLMDTPVEVQDTVLRQAQDALELPPIQG
jgi:hypothetical protein